MSFLKVTLAAACILLTVTQKPKPTLYIIGDSTVKNGTGDDKTSLWGWGSLLSAHFDTTKIVVENHAIGGRSSRTFINEGRWDKIVARLKKGDYVLLQFGHNDSGPLADSARARGSIKGTGTESTIVYNPKLKAQEEVYTYGGYLRKYVKEAKEKGAIPIICSPVPRNAWKNGVVAGTDYQIWAKQVAEETKSLYLPLNEMISTVYQKQGEEKIKTYFPVDHTHTNKDGATLNAEMVALGIKNFKSAKLKDFLRYDGTKLVTIAENGWAKNSINTVIFRKNSLTTHKHIQYAAYYDEDQYVVLAKRESDLEEWTVSRTEYKGDATDAHKSISIIVDGDGYVHAAWGQHNNSLNYAVGVSPGSLELSKKTTMLSSKEAHVSYPEFYNLSDGDILFLYRDGGSGNGNLMLNRYDVKRKTWVRVQDNMIDGQGRRNAYWQMALDQKGTIHLSWVWRESPDVASNHDMCYAKSSDGGKTWQNSEGASYTLPITESNAEYACRIPQKSELINQTSMFADDKGQVFIASYWRTKGQDVPQYHIIFKDGNQWEVNDLDFRSTSFSLSGVGTKRIPISRPQIIAWNKGKQQAAALIFRDSERGNKVSLAINENIKGSDWIIKDLTNTEVGDWEPSYDTELWKKRSILNLFIQKVTQVDGEGKASVGASAVQVLQWKPKL